MKELNDILSRLLAAQGPPGTLATLVSVEGSSYRRPGARLLLSGSGERRGSISGGCLEEDLMARSMHVTATGKAELVVYDTTSENDLVWGVGLGCHGVAQVLIERLPTAPHWAQVLADNFRIHQPTSLAVVWKSNDPAALGTHLASELPALPADSRVFFNSISPPPALFIFGAGDDAAPLVRLAKELGWHVTVADPRPAFATRERFPDADALVVAPSAELARRAAPPADALAVVMTHHYVHDVPVLRDLLNRPLQYLGLLGPKQRAERILADITGGPAVLPQLRSQLHAPVGLDVGAENPEEVALSIIAEMQATLAGRDGRPLHERSSPIHR